MVLTGGKREVLLNVQSSHHHSADIPNVWHSYFLLRLSNLDAVESSSNDKMFLWFVLITMLVLTLNA